MDTVSNNKFLNVKQTLFIQLLITKQRMEIINKFWTIINGMDKDVFNVLINTYYYMKKQNNV